MTVDGPTALPRLPAGRRAVLYALRRRGEATAEQVAEQLGMTVSGARQHLTALAHAGPRRRARDPADRARSAGAARSRTRRPRRPTPTSRRHTASSPTSCSATSPTPTPTLLDDLFAKRRQHRIENAQARLAGKRTLGTKVAELAKILDEDGYLATYEKVGTGRLPRDRAQLRDLGGGAAVRAGVHQRDRLHPRVAARRDRRAGAAHGRRRPPLRLRDQSPRRSLINASESTGKRYSAASRSAMSERWHASGSRSTQQQRGRRTPVGISATIGARSTWSRISRM